MSNTSIKSRKTNANKFTDSDGNYQKQAINWKKIFIFISIFFSVCLCLYLIWGIGFGGNKYLKMNKEAKLMYETVFAENDIDNYKEKTNAKWEEDSWSQLEDINSELVEKDYSYNKKAYVVEISNKISKNDCWIAITDKSRTADDNPDGEKPSQTIFVHHEIVDGTIIVTDIKDPYETAV